MSKRFAGRRILVVEDEYLLAQCLADLLQNEGAQVLGPASCMEDADALLDGSPLPDAAVLDINLGNQNVYPLADRLADGHVPLLFTSGYDRELVPVRHADSPRCAKPFGVDQVRTQLLALLDVGADAGADVR
ncbi:conserved hypothetical protein [uncultured Stenotrophomonas sp.]|uniref:Response regulatory domain-containing protein n=1 Tax=uncultured Stenotrophomonas sp. TaxID=165438 RepID=A0A1Y5Q5R5_9GAMM|nr:conserved hypothetical protein [uncultured Stenotrophomonas sp.]